MAEDIVTSRHSSTSNLRTHTASVKNSTARVECVGLSSLVILKVNEATTDFVIKTEAETLIAMREVLNMWYEAEIVKRGR